MVDIVWSTMCTDHFTIEGIYRKHCLKKAANIKDQHHPGHALSATIRKKIQEPKIP